MRYLWEGRRFVGLRGLFREVSWDFLFVISFYEFKVDLIRIFMNFFSLFICLVWLVE